MKRSSLEFADWAGRPRLSEDEFGIPQFMTDEGGSRASGSPWEGGG